MNLKSKIREIIKEELSKIGSGEIICYHRSNSLEHMMNANFSLEQANDVALFGHAIYHNN